MICGVDISITSTTQRGNEKRAAAYFYFAAAHCTFSSIESTRSDYQLPRMITFRCGFISKLHPPRSSFTVCDPCESTSIVDVVSEAPLFPPTAFGISTMTIVLSSTTSSITSLIMLMHAAPGPHTLSVAIMKTLLSSSVISNVTLAASTNVSPEPYPGDGSFEYPMTSRGIRCPIPTLPRVLRALRAPLRLRRTETRSGRLIELMSMLSRTLSLLKEMML